MKLPSQRILFLLSFLVVTGLLGFGFFLEFVKGVAPCPLCVLQRVTFALLGTIFLLGAILPLKRCGNLITLTAASLTSLLGMLLAGRQVWLQQLPPLSSADCGASLHYLMQVLTWDQVLAKILQGTTECTRIGWEFLGLSLAAWTFICFSGFFILSIVEMFHQPKR